MFALRLGSANASKRGARMPTEVHNSFDFRVLRQNRRVVKDDGNASRKAEIEDFHKVLMDVSMGVASDRVRRFIIRAYVKGMLSCGGKADNCDFEGNTAVFTKRRYRDRWNKTIVQRIAKVANHSLKISSFLFQFFLKLNKLKFSLINIADLNNKL